MKKNRSKYTLSARSLTSKLIITFSSFLLFSCQGTMKEIGDATSNAFKNAQEAFKEASKESSEPAKASNEEAAGLKAAGIFDIFVDKPYDKSKKSDHQWPRVAIDVIESPENVDSSYMMGLTNLPEGCFTMQATIWQSQNEKRRTDTFQWCSPNDIAFGTPLKTYSDWASGWANTVAVRQNSGNDRTNVLPPNSYAPGGIKYQRAFRNSISYGQYYGTGSHLGLMMFSVAAHSGIDPSNWSDHRIWFTKIDPVE